MKISILDRVLLTLFTLAVAALMVFVLLFTWGALPMADLQYSIGLITQSTVNIIIISAVGVIMLILSIKLLFAGTKKQPPKSVLLRTTPNGSIRVAVFAIDELTQRCVKANTLIRDVKSSVQSVQDGVRILLWVSCRIDTVIPEAITELQNNVKEYVEMYSGVTVSDVHIYVENTSSASVRQPE